MNKLKVLSMQCDAIDQLLLGFFAMVFSVADERMPDGGKLCTDLVLQTCYQLNSYKCRGGKCSIYGIVQFSAGSFRIA